MNDKSDRVEIVTQYTGLFAQPDEQINGDGSHARVLIRTWTSSDSYTESMVHIGNDFDKEEFKKKTRAMVCVEKDGIEVRRTHEE